MKRDNREREEPISRGEQICLILIGLDMLLTTGTSKNGALKNGLPQAMKILTGLDGESPFMYNLADGESKIRIDPMAGTVMLMPESNRVVLTRWEYSQINQMRNDLMVLLKEE